jgi:hypothetical protein
MGPTRTGLVATALLVVGAAAGVACSPFGGGNFSCTEDTQCGTGGMCEANGLCSFPDPVCAGGWRYGDASGSLSGVCVGEEPIADASPMFDATPDYDSPPGTPDASCVVDGLDLCAQAAPDPALTFGTETLDTDNDARCRDENQAGGGDQLCLIYATSITVTAGATLTVVGDKPLALASTGLVLIEGVIDAGSTETGREGPNSNPSGCGGFPSGPATDEGGGGGGAGGSFSGNGGDGGTGDENNNGNPSGTAAGGTNASPVGLPAFVRGGCDGQDGGDEGGGGSSGNGGNGSAGGGAVWVVSMSEVRVAAGGGVTVGGGGGGRGEPQSGGGGGGAGGMIRIGCPQIMIMGTLAANGGGGGGGGAEVRIGPNDIRVNGNPGSDGALGSSGAGGGQGGTIGGTTYGGDGGAGGALATSDGGTGEGSDVGAGGGGGSAGFIVLHGTANVTGTVSPAAVN